MKGQSEITLNRGSTMWDSWRQERAEQEQEWLEQGQSVDLGEIRPKSWQRALIPGILEALKSQLRDSDFFPGQQPASEGFMPFFRALVLLYSSHDFIVVPL